jgi:hypothetical protein
MLPFDLSERPDEDEANNFIAHQITITKNDTIPPSKLLNDTARVKYVTNLLDLKRTANVTMEVSVSDKEKADLLLIKLREQFKSHVKARV